MKRIFTNLFIILVITVIAVGCGKKQQPMDLYDSIQQRGKLVVGVRTDIEPFGFKDSEGNYQGFEIDLARQIAKVLLKDENAIEFVEVEPSTRISTVNSGQADMIIATMSISSKRLNILDFSDPYYFAGQKVLTHAKSNIKSLSDLNGKRVGVGFGTTTIEGIKSVALEAIIQGYKTYQEAISALKADEIDAFADDDALLIRYIIKDKGFKILPQKYTQEPYAIAFRKGTESARTIQIVNNALNIMKTNGTLNQMKAQWQIK